MSDLRYLSLTLNGGFLLLGGMFLGGPFGNGFGLFLFWIGFLILFVQLLLLAGRAVYRFFSWIAAPDEAPPADKS